MNESVELNDSKTVICHQEKLPPTGIWKAICTI